MTRPLTIVEQGKTSPAELAAAVLKTREQHGDLLQKYHQVWYECGHTWHYTHFLGVGLMKSPNDLWVYQDLMTSHRPKTIIETGTYQGGSALWLACLSDMLNLDCQIWTVDIENYQRCTHPKIAFLRGDSTSVLMAAQLKREIAYPLLVILDADHSAEHVRKELELYAPMCQVGDWLIVEDTNIAWPGPQGDRGAAGGLRDYLDQHPGEWMQDILSERYLLTMNPGGWMQRVGECR